MENFDVVVSELKNIVTSDNLFVDEENLNAYAVDGLQPKAVVFPTEVAQIQKILALAHREEVAVIPRGHGTKMSLGNVPKRADIVLSLAKLDQIVEFLPDDLTVTAQAGMTLPALQNHLIERGLFLPLDPACSGKTFANPATIGGIVSTNSNGPKRLKYNSIRDLALGMSIVLADGTLIHAGGRTVKNVSGYDLTRLFIGSLGTLGVITEVTFRLIPPPESGKTVLASFSELSPAANVVAKILDSELLPAAIELFNPRGAEQLGMPGEHLLLAVDIEDVAEATERQKGQIKQLCETEGSLHVSIVEGSERNSLCECIQDWTLLAKGPKVTLKINVPIGKVSDTFQKVDESAGKLELYSALMSHAGSGIVYATLAGGIGELETAIAEITDIAQESGGSSAAEDAPIEIKRNIDVWGKPRMDATLIRQIKKQFDPKGLLNPGRFVGGL